MLLVIWAGRQGELVGKCEGSFRINCLIYTFYMYDSLTKELVSQNFEKKVFQKSNVFLHIIAVLTLIASFQNNHLPQIIAPTLPFSSSPFFHPAKLISEDSS